MLSQEEGKQLLALARKSIECYFSDQDMDFRPFRKFGEKQGVFVTLHKHGELRGCIGFPMPSLQLYKAVFEAARAAAFEDPRFPELKEDELEDVKIEVSVLTVPEELKSSPDEYPKHISIGKDGLIIRGPFGSGLLLPQVFTEYNCTPERALEMTCQKAGIQADAWRDARNRVFRFQAQIFKEED